MIIGIFHPGSGLGNQLHRYVATRVLALDKGYDFSMINREGFKGKTFMKLDMGKLNDVPNSLEIPTGKIVPWLKNIDCKLWQEWDKFTYDPDFNFIEDNTIIDGNFEDSKYFEHRMDEIYDWLKTDELEIPNDVCVIGFRGGEYYTVPELGLPGEWFYEAMTKVVLEVNPKMRFEIHTDDEELAKKFFPGFKIVRDIGLNWRAIRYAKYAIIANSSFYVLPRLLRHGSEGFNWDFEPIKTDAVTIAPRYWNRYNTKKWDYPQNYYKQFIYI